MLGEPSPTCSRASTERRGKKPSARLPLPTDAERPPLGSPFTSAIRARPGSRERGPSASGRADGRRPRVPPRAPPVPAHNRLGRTRAILVRSRYHPVATGALSCRRREIQGVDAPESLAPCRRSRLARRFGGWHRCAARRRTMTLTRRPSGSSRNPASQDEAGRLAEAFDLALDEGGAFRFVSPSYGDVPTVPGIGPAAALGPGDEGERETTAEAPDFEALRRVTPVGDDEAARKTAAGLARAGLAPPESVDALHSELTFQVPGDSERSLASDRHDCALPTGPRRRAARRTGARACGDVRAPDGGIVSCAGRRGKLERGPSVELLPPGQARHECASRYPPRSKIRKPRLVYWAPPASQRVRAIYPHWECNGTDPQGAALVLALIPAFELLPVTIDADVDGDEVTATAHVSSGTPPFTCRWASMTTSLGGNDDTSSITYQVALAKRPRPRSSG